MTTTTTLETPTVPTPAAPAPDSSAPADPTPAAGPRRGTDEPGALWFELNHFYIAEAWLLDERRLREWIDLFTEDMLYYMPRRKNVSRRELDREIPARGTDLPYFDDDRKLMEVRIQRVETGMAWAEEPPSRTRHIIGNLLVQRRDDGTVLAKTGFLCYRSHFERDVSLYAGYREDVLRQVEGEWKIAHRTVVLDTSVIHDKNIAIFF